MALSTDHRLDADGACVQAAVTSAASLSDSNGPGRPWWGSRALAPERNRCPGGFAAAGSGVGLVRRLLIGFWRCCWREHARAC